MFRAHRAHHQERQIVSIQPVVAVGGCVVCRFTPFLYTTQSHRQLPEVVLIQFVSPDDEHCVIETCRELKIEINAQKINCVSRWSLIKNQLHDHGQENVQFI
jgi:hypothetical protein